MFKFDFDTFAKRSLKQIGNVLVKQATKNMKKTSFGRVYIIGGKAHIASKVGDSPNSLSGDLMGSIRYKIKGKVLEFGAGDKRINYAKFLEPTRPNYTKSIIQSKKQIDELIKKEFNKSMRFSK